MLIQDKRQLGYLWMVLCEKILWNTADLICLLEFIFQKFFSVNFSDFLCYTLEFVDLVAPVSEEIDILVCLFPVEIDVRTYSSNPYKLPFWNCLCFQDSNFKEKTPDVQSSSILFF